MVMPGMAAATRWRIAGPEEKSPAVSVRMMTEADGGWRARRNEPASCSTMCTRAAFTPFIAWMVRAISPSSALTRVISCMNEVSPMEPILSNSS